MDRGVLEDMIEEVGERAFSSEYMSVRMAKMWEEMVRVRDRKALSYEDDARVRESEEIWEVMGAGGGESACDDELIVENGEMQVDYGSPEEMRRESKEMDNERSLD